MLLTQLGGFWGPPTSSVDWCEANYVHSRFVAEWFNTLSSGAMVLAGLAGLLLHRRVLEKRFLAAFGLLILVGLGSVAFHGTLRFELQMMDELPMVYLVLLMVYVLVEDGPVPRRGPLFPWALVGYGALVTYLNAFTRGQVQFWIFQLSFGSLEFFCLGSVWRLSRRSADAGVHRMFRLGLGAYALGIVLWFVDIRFCPLVSQALPRLGVPNPQLHAWWHVLVSMGFYALLLVIAHERLVVLGRAPRWRAALGPGWLAISRAR